MQFSRLIREMVRKKSASSRSPSDAAFVLKCTKYRPRINPSGGSGLNRCLLLSSAFLLASCLFSGIYAAELSEQEQQSSSSVGGGAGDQPPELKSIEHTIEEQCIQNCAEQVKD